MKEEHLVSLIVRRLSGELDSEGMAELEAWAEEDPSHRKLLDRLVNEADLDKEIAVWRSIDPAAGYAQWLAEVDAADRVISIRRRKRIAYFAAASIILVVFAGRLLWRSQSVEKPAPVVAVAVPDIKPGGNKALLTLSGGARIELDGAKSGKIAEQGGREVQKVTDGEVTYASAGATSSEVLYNSISTPPGGQYAVTLSDGTKVWLNAASWIRFPTSFKEGSRRVEIGGEAYFEVAKDKSKPFLVSSGGMEVQVLGTHFDINAYSNEPTIRTTLLEGSVKVVKGKSALVLAPGDQASVCGEQVTVARNANLEEAVAWKNGFFEFNGADIQSVMRSLERWYDVKVVYEGEIPQVQASGSISRNNMASVVMQVLQASGFHFRIEKNTIIVMP